MLLNPGGYEIPVTKEAFPSSGPDVKHEFSNQLSIYKKICRLHWNFPYFEFNGLRCFDLPVAKESCPLGIGMKNPTKTSSRLVQIWHGLKKRSYANTDSLESRLGYSFKNKNLRQEALTHKSRAGERGDDFHNERLEFLGDSVFDLSVSDLLMQAHPQADEGTLSKMRSALVNTNDLAELALSLKLDQELLLSSGEARDKGQLKPRLLACVLEALIGAIYVDGGYKKAKKVVGRLMGTAIQKGPINRDYKSLLQEWVQKRHKKTPSYNVLKVTGPHHEKVFVMEVRVDHTTWGVGRGPSKKQAEQSAALVALRRKGRRLSI